ncbi:MAG: polysaccharide pyruvyl transferase family protein [Spirochaetaceae bacterium]|nr:polysaccharide pyruvyl transferase family protein [Spirochaetaceae bacterium]
MEMAFRQEIKNLYSLLSPIEEEHQNHYHKINENSYNISKINSRRMISNKMNNVLFIGDNTDVLNFGCRATSAALAEILGHSVAIIDRIYRKEITHLFINTPLCDDWYLYLKTVKEYDIECYEYLLSRIKKNNAVILNGEGSFIFQSPPRLDLHNYLVILHACIETGTPFYILNAMFSAFADEPINEDLINQAMPILEQAEIFAARDIHSQQIISQYNDKVNVTFIPDALFSWYSLYNENRNILNDMLHNSRLVLPFIDHDPFQHNMDFSHPYALFSGNSFAAKHPDQARNSFTKLVLALKNQAEKLGISLYLIETCSGDAVIRQVALEIKIPIIPVNTNIYFAGKILGNALCYVSGRYHPSILASMGGTPCVFMGSNSHKTLSIQTVLGIPPEEQELFPAIPDEDLVPHIVSSFEKKILNQNREQVRNICKTNASIVQDKISMLFKTNFLANFF